MSKKQEKYFKHDNNARNDQKIIEIRRKYGLKGYGIYFCLIELLNSTENYELKKNYDSIVFDLREDREIIVDIIENFDLFKIKENYFYSNSLKRRMLDLDMLIKEREKAGKKGAQARWKKEKPQSNLPPKL